MLKIVFNSNELSLLKSIKNVILRYLIIHMEWDFRSEVHLESLRIFICRLIIAILQQRQVKIDQILLNLSYFLLFRSNGFDQCHVCNDNKLSFDWNRNVYGWTSSKSSGNRCSTRSNNIFIEYDLPIWLHECNFLGYSYCIVKFFVIIFLFPSN